MKLKKTMALIVLQLLTLAALALMTVLYFSAEDGDLIFTKYIR